MGKEAKYVVRLDSEEWQQMTALVSKGRGAAAVLRRARVLLKADTGKHGPGGTDEKIVEALDVSQSTVYRVRQTFVEQGLEAALYRKKPTGRQYRKTGRTPRGPFDCRCLQCSSSWPESLDTETFGRQTGGIGNR